MKLGCMICHDLHKATEKHFPLTKFGIREVDGKKERYVEGYICRKCIRKEAKREHARKIQRDV